MRKYSLFFIAAFVFSLAGYAQIKPWHDTIRTLHYRPQGADFAKVDGKLRFNRALYGTNTAFRVEAGDLPEFAMYLPGMGGNLKFGLIHNDQHKWLIDAANIETVYRPGAMIYRISDPVMGKATLSVTVLALADKEGMVVRLHARNMPAGIKLIALYGGASGKKFSRNGDIGADPESSFYLLPEYCTGNEFSIDRNTFTLQYGAKKQQVNGLFPAGMKLRISNAQMTAPLSADTAAASDKYPVLAGKMDIPANSDLYFLLQTDTKSTDAPAAFRAAEQARKQLADRIVIQTPDSFINTLGGALGIAADGIWEDSSYLHGAVAWRMRLNAWRGAYVADPLGWHDRAAKHFSSYSLSQVTSPENGPVVFDTALHLARHLEKMGTSMFSSGYISRNPGGDQRPHHYDMNLVFIDQLLNHFNWSGDTGYVKQMWPLLKRHLAWEKRNFDADNDGLYDAYACIWASDALQYSGGGVMHSSAYNYRANRSAAMLAGLIGEDGTSYRDEADKILAAINKNLWLQNSGSYAEYKDLLGNKLVHEDAAAWTVYHTMDAAVPDAFQAYQLLNYADHNLPRIPVVAKGLTGQGLYLTATTNWQPYTWSINNVALAENLHLSLAYWQGGNQEQAYKLWRSALIESMYLSASPGGFEQLSFYDAMRGELYRDFADPIGMAGRTLVEGLFGILPDALHDTLLIRPGFPAEWNSAALQTPDIKLDYKRTGTEEQYKIRQSFRKSLTLKLEVPVQRTHIVSVLVNGKRVKWYALAGVGKPLLLIHAGKERLYDIVIRYSGDHYEKVSPGLQVAQGNTLLFTTQKAIITGRNDSTVTITEAVQSEYKLSGIITADTGGHLLFIKLKQGDLTWWHPLNVQVLSPFGVQLDKQLVVTNHTNKAWRGSLKINNTSMSIVLPADSFTTLDVTGKLVNGNNEIQLLPANTSTAVLKSNVYQWIPGSIIKRTLPVDLSAYYNDKVMNIFRHKYLSPRSPYPTLQLPTQGIGNWCYPLIQPEINDSGLRKLAVANGITELAGVPFKTIADTLSNNVLFVSMWDNFADKAKVPLTGHAKHLYLLMTGTTNHMQYGIMNGSVKVNYKDGSSAVLPLINPETWWPVEQDYYEDGYAFHLNKPVPPRVHLKDGTVHYKLDGPVKYTTLKGFSNKVIAGGAATILDIPLDEDKELADMDIRAIANDVVIGLMSATLIR